MARFGVGEQHPALEGRVSDDIGRRDIGLVQKEHDLAPSAAQRWPAAGGDGLRHSGVAPAHLIRGDHLVWTEDRPDFRIQRIQHVRGEHLRRCHVRNSRNRRLGLGLDEDEDRHMTGMSQRPCPDLAKTGDERLAIAHIIDVLDVQDLEARLQHDAVRVERRRAAGIERRAERMGETPPRGVGEDVELDLANAVIELARQVGVTVVERCETPADCSPARPWRRRESGPRDSCCASRSPGSD